MKHTSLGEAKIISHRTHTVTDDILIPERIEAGTDPGLQFELAGPRAKLFFDAATTRAGSGTHPPVAFGL